LSFRQAKIIDLQEQPLPAALAGGSASVIMASATTPLVWLKPDLLFIINPGLKAGAMKDTLIL